MANQSRRLAAGVSSLLRIFSSKPRAAAAAAAIPVQQEVKPRAAAAAIPVQQKVKSKAAAAAAAIPVQKEVDLLWRKLFVLSCTEGEVKNAINAYVEEGKTVTKVELDRLIANFRRFKRPHHALEIAEWMQSQKYELKQKDYSIYLEVLAKAKGITAAEYFFNALSPSRKAKCTYESLLYCFCHEKMSDEALDLFSKMVQANMITAPWPFNYLMVMHINLGQPEKVIRLEEEMKKANIQPNISTYNLLMKAYGHLNYIEGVERVFKEMTEEKGKLCTWKTYSTLALIYIEAGDQEKAKTALQNLEKAKSVHDREAYHYLITLYGRMSDLENAHRVWKLLKAAMGVRNSSYLIMIRALNKLDDMEGLKECFEEWESVLTTYDRTLANAVVAAYLSRDMLKEAESVLERALVRLNGHFFYAWEWLMIYHLKKHRVKEALEIMERAVSKARVTRWKPRCETIDEFLNYFEEASDVSSAEEFYVLMKRINCVDCHLYESLLRVYNIAGRKLRYARRRIERDGVDMSSDLARLVTSVSLE